MNKLNKSKRLGVLQMLIEGESIPVVSRSIGVSVNTVTKLLTDAGQACLTFQQNVIENQTFEDTQRKQVWSYTSPPGDIWTLIKLSTSSGFVIEWGLCRHLNLATESLSVSIGKELLSNKLCNHMHVLSLYFVFYNFCRNHEQFHCTPAVQAGLSQISYNLEWIANLSDGTFGFSEMPDTKL